MINPFKKLKTEVENLKIMLTDSLKKTTGEFDQHLDSINENTNEIQANYEYLCELDKKIQKLSERLDGLQHTYAESEKPVIKPLTVQEKRVFKKLLYAKKPLSYEEIAETLNANPSLVATYITSLIEKGVPVVKKYLSGQAFLTIDVDNKENLEESAIID